MKRSIQPRRVKGAQHSFIHSDQKAMHPSIEREKEVGNKVTRDLRPLLPAYESCERNCAPLSPVPLLCRRRYTHTPPTAQHGRKAVGTEAGTVETRRTSYTHCLNSDGALKKSTLLRRAIHSVPVVLPRASPHHALTSTVPIGYGW